MVLNHYKASKGCTSLNNFLGKQHRKEIYKELLEEGTIKGQCKELLKIYLKHPEGLTDIQASKILHWDSSTVSGRRNDLTKKVGRHVIITEGKRSNGKGRRTGCVWKISSLIKVN